MPDTWELGRSETQITPLEDTDLVMVIPPTTGEAPALRRVDHLRTDLDPDLPAGLDRRLATLEALVADLRPGLISTGWADVTADAAGGIAIGPNAWSLADAIAHTGWGHALQSPDGVELARIPDTADVATYRLHHVSVDGYLFEEPLSTIQRLGASGGWQYYTHDAVIESSGTARITLQATTSTAHIGSSRYVGRVDKGQIFAALQAIVTGAGAVIDPNTETITIA